MWILIIERYWYFRTGHLKHVEEVLAYWKERPEHHSWHAHQVRQMLVSQVSTELERGIPMIKTLVALCPFLGLLGTVTGMISVFDVLAAAGSGNPRAMASGVELATVPTMSGMVAALSGFIPSVTLERTARTETQRVADQLSPEEA